MSISMYSWSRRLHKKLQLVAQSRFYLYTGIQFLPLVSGSGFNGYFPSELGELFLSPVCDVILIDYSQPRTKKSPTHPGAMLTVGGSDL